MSLYLTNCYVNRQYETVTIISIGREHEVAIDILFI